MYGISTYCNVDCYVCETHSESTLIVPMYVVYSKYGDIYCLYKLLNLIYADMNGAADYQIAELYLYVMYRLLCETPSGSTLIVLM